MTKWSPPVTNRLGGKHTIVIGCLIVVGVGVDQITKALAVARLVPGRPIQLVGDLFQFSLYRNPGASFSMGAGLTLLFTFLAVAVLVGTLAWVVPKVRCWTWAVAVGLGLAGVAGNLIDRLVRAPGPFRGHVVDFLALKHFAVFNVADVLLTSAAGLIVLLTVFFRRDFDGRGLGPRAKPVVTPEGEGPC